MQSENNHLAHSARLFHGQSQVGIGVYDGLSALLAAKWHFDFTWVSSFCCSAAAGLPDAGIVGAEDMLSVVRRVRRSADLPIVVDIDSGYGDAVKVYYVAEAMARAGAAALCIEDNPPSKRCSLYDGYERALVSVEEHIARLRAARAGVAAAGVPCQIIARTEALVAGLGVPEALRRAAAYADAGAEAVFIQSLDATGGEVLTFGRQWRGRTPLFIAPTRLPKVTKKEFFDAGISHVIFANQGLRAAHTAMDRTFRILADADSAQEAEAGISSIAEVAVAVGAGKVVELEAFLAGAQAGHGTPSPAEKRPRKSVAARGIGLRGSKKKLIVH
ncbi:MAG TPA: isocitrate lyase/PEP mutase family protein [Candidatus Binatia bacterium]|jgi:phosphoenolpyruvate phosphomutase|nr:isocitrate lyase/PEP mutase family protein [Candidatus Binatia bacterium]